MAKPNSVKILEETRVTPFFDSLKSIKEFSLPLTFLEIYWFVCPPVECLYFYELTESTSTPTYFNSKILPKLKQSLSLSLFHYLPLAGNLKWPSNSSPSPIPFILCTPNDGVSLTVAESIEGNFHKLSGKEMSQANELHPLVPKLMISDGIAPILSLQITLFPSQGFSICITTHKGAIDGKVVTMFMKCWAYLYKQCNKVSSSLPPELTPFFDKSIIKDPRLDLLSLNEWLAFSSSNSDLNKRNFETWKGMNRPDPDNLVRATFEFTPEDIKKLREKASFKVKVTDNDVKPNHLSNFVLTYAYIAVCLIRAKREEVDRPITISVSANCRSHLCPPLPITYFGSCNLCFKNSAKASDFIDEDGFNLAIKMISNSIEVLKKGVHHNDLEEKVREFYAPDLPRLQLINVAGSPKLKIYETDFGFGRPKKVEIVSIDWNEAISILESGDLKGGIEVGLVLKKFEMETFSSLFFDGLETIRRISHL